MKTLIILAHPDIESSVANKVIIERLAQEENVTIRNINTLYPDYKINVAAEQEALIAADTVIF